MPVTQPEGGRALRPHSQRGHDMEHFQGNSVSAWATSGPISKSRIPCPGNKDFGILDNTLNLEKYIYSSYILYKLHCANSVKNPKMKNKSPRASVPE